jgi:hypothetical protein
MELTPTESGGLRRMDVREVGAVARSLARFPFAGSVSLQPAHRRHAEAAT